MNREERDKADQRQDQLHQAHRRVEHAYRALSTWYLGIDPTLPRSKIDHAMGVVRKCSEIRALMNSGWPDPKAGQSDAEQDNIRRNDGPVALIQKGEHWCRLFVHGEFVKTVPMHEADSLEQMAYRINKAAAQETA